MTVTDIAVRNGTTELAIDPSQDYWNEKQLAALRHLGVDDASRADQAIFFHQCVRTGLDPFVKQIYMIGRRAKENDQWVTKQTIQTGIDGFRLVGRRAADHARHSVALSDTLWCGEDGKWVDVWLSDKPPAAAKVTVFRNGDPFPAVAVFNEFAGRTRKGDINSMWSSKGSLMIAKCAEALAWRKAFPQDLSGLYIAEEMAQEMAGEESPAPAAPSRSSVNRLKAAIQPEADEPTDPTDEGVTATQLKELARLFADKGYTDKAEGLEYIQSKIGRPVATSKYLTTSEAATVIAALAAIDEPDAPVDAEIVPDDADAQTTIPEATE